MRGGRWVRLALEGFGLSPSHLSQSLLRPMMVCVGISLGRVEEHAWWQGKEGLPAMGLTPDNLRPCRGMGVARITRGSSVALPSSSSFSPTWPWFVRTETYPGGQPKRTGSTFSRRGKSSRSLTTAIIDPVVNIRALTLLREVCRCLVSWSLGWGAGEEKEERRKTGGKVYPLGLALLSVPFLFRPCFAVTSCTADMEGTTEGEDNEDMKTEKEKKSRSNSYTWFHIAHERRQVLSTIIHAQWSAPLLLRFGLATLRALVVASESTRVAFTEWERRRNRNQKGRYDTDTGRTRATRDNH